MTSYNQQGDIHFYQTLDGGEVNFENGLIEMTRMLESSVYLCLVGGNAEDDGTPSGKKYEWSGNEDEPDDKRFRSRFQALLNGKPITSQLIRDLGEAAALDIIDGHPGIVESVLSQVLIDGHRKLNIISYIILANSQEVEIMTRISL